MAERMASGRGGWAFGRWWTGVLLATLQLVPSSITAQAGDPDPPPVTIPDTELRFLTAASNGVGYKLYVGLPNGYEEGQERYPVIFTLDADYSFAIARNVVEHLSDRNHLRRAIVVGIAYDGPLRYRLNRTRDYTPVYAPDGGYGPEYQRVSGGAPAFLDFIADELVPWLAREYRTTDERVLAGHSYGGLFASWVAVTRPELFIGLVAVSPSLWYADGMIFELEDQAARTRDDLPLGIEWNVAENETHNSIFPRALSNGLRFVLRGR